VDDPNVLYGTIVQVSGTMVAIVGGFLAAYAVARGDHKNEDFEDQINLTWSALWRLLILTIVGIAIPLFLIPLGPEKLSDAQAGVLIVLFLISLGLVLTFLFGIVNR